MIVVAVVSVRGDGNVLVDVRFVAESDLGLVERRLPMPASLIVVRFADSVLTLFNGWRRQWELPGGMREPGETARQAALRELGEETGIGVLVVGSAEATEHHGTRCRTTHMPLTARAMPGTKQLRLGRTTSQPRVEPEISQSARRWTGAELAALNDSGVGVGVGSDTDQPTGRRPATSSWHTQAGRVVPGLSGAKDRRRHRADGHGQRGGMRRQQR
ncbi:MAG: NUDIX hydrolase [Pseudonocardiaceae bacterium]